MTGKQVLTPEAGSSLASLGSNEAPDTLVITATSKASTPEAAGRLWGAGGKRRQGWVCRSQDPGLATAEEGFS